MIRPAADAFAWCVLTAIAAAVATYLRRPDDWLVLGVRLGEGGLIPAGWRPVRSKAALAVGATVLGTLAVPNAATQAALVAFVGVGAFGISLRRNAMVRQRAAEFRGDIARVLSSVAAELRAGGDPVAALAATVADESAEWAPVRTATAVDVAAALRALSSRPGGESLAEVAAAWHIADQTGSPLATVLERMAGSVRAEVDLDREVAVEAAPARATGRLMALLPMAGLGLGLLLGVNPVRVLLTTGVGVTCLVAGLALACLGVWLIERIVAQAEVR